MLNCTDLECILHAQHYYDHLHYLQNGFHQQQAMSTETEGFNDESIRERLNETDAPSESLYMIGGVCVAMFMVGLIIVLLAVTISKLRKREEHSNSVHPVTDVVLQTTPTAQINNHQSSPPQALQTDLTYRGQILWTQPPPPTSQFLYNNNQDTLVQNLPTERPGFVRGFRKNLGGKWRRLVKRKPPQEVYTIPAELKPQLKQIYVY
ncbi:uncharacterized protein isoform X4 [Leptinotarsa decemlineata]|uniref:uncharacterized protein isoform X4 n=1 Tax=Leptinotarsa decemlineata TaxID=7539 RepID=UPI003D3067B6